MRIRSVAVVIDSGEVLLIRRERDGRVYSVLPGGAVEPGESLEDACLRELREETGLIGRVQGLLSVPVDLESPAFYLRVSAASWDLQLGGPEAARASTTNTYSPEWVTLAESSRCDLVPVGAVTAIRSAVATES
jgi:ADP-ribose pyrophosphatase YjhB (NUDIX family)